MATRCRWPPDSSFGRCVIRGSKSTFSSAVRALRLAIARRHTRVNQRQLDVLQRRRTRQQVERLEDEPDLLVPDARQLVVVHVADALAVQQVGCPLDRRVEASDQIHQRGLARARRPHDRDVLAALDRHGDAAQRMDLLVAHDVGLPQVVGFDQRPWPRRRRQGASGSVLHLGGRIGRNVRGPRPRVHRHDDELEARQASACAAVR